MTEKRGRPKVWQNSLKGATSSPKTRASEFFTAIADWLVSSPFENAISQHYAKLLQAVDEIEKLQKQVGKLLKKREESKKSINVCNSESLISKKSENEGVKSSLFRCNNWHWTYEDGARAISS